MPSTHDVRTRIAEIGSQLQHAGQLLTASYTPRELAALVRSGKLIRVRRGWYLPSSEWAAMHAEDRQLALIHAAHADARTRPLFSHYSAAALHGLPLDDRIPSLAHIVTSPHRKGGVSGNCVRHRLEIAHTDLVEVGPYLCTSPDRTVLDLALTAPLPLSLSCADALLRQSFRVERQIDHASVQGWRSSMRARARDHAGARGIRGARWVTEFADPRADSPLERVSRYHLLQLGFDFEIQVPVPSPKGSTYYIDFEFTGLQLFGECDGKLKYLDERLFNGSTATERVYSEKRRSDWISGREQKRIIRWGWPDVSTTRHFATRLLAFHVPIPKPPRGLTLPTHFA